MSPIQPVDAVITWVDGTEIAHKKKLAQYLKSNRIERTEHSPPTRYNQCGELIYCIQSIMRYAPWIRIIHIVTDQQTPMLLETLTHSTWSNRIKLVDHKALFHGFEQHLPTFNSLSIEIMLWRIANLSEQYIYFNDDCLLIRPVKYEDFFRGTKVVLRGQWKWMRNLGFRAQTFYRSIQQRSAQEIGYYWRYFRVSHIPFPLLKSVLADYFSKHPELLQQNIQHRLRDPNQIWAISLSYHLLLSSRRAIIDNSLTSVQIHPGFHSQEKIKSRLERTQKKTNTHFLCIQSMDLAEPKFREWIFQWISSRIIG
jgi:hypothetical protein